MVWLLKLCMESGLLESKGCPMNITCMFVGITELRIQTKYCPLEFLPQIILLWLFITYCHECVWNVNRTHKSRLGILYHELFLLLYYFMYSFHMCCTCLVSQSQYTITTHDYEYMYVCMYVAYIHAINIS